MQDGGWLYVHNGQIKVQGRNGVIKYENDDVCDVYPKGILSSLFYTQSACAADASRVG